MVRPVQQILCVTWLLHSKWNKSLRRHLCSSLSSVVFSAAAALLWHLIISSGAKGQTSQIPQMQSWRKKRVTDWEWKREKGFSIPNCVTPLWHLKHASDTHTGGSSRRAGQDGRDYKNPIVVERQRREEGKDMRVRLHQSLGCERRAGESAEERQTQRKNFVEMYGSPKNTAEAEII